MSFGGYETSCLISGMAMGVAALVVPVRTEKDRLGRLGLVGIGAGMAVYAFYVAGQTSGIYYFPGQLMVLPWLFLGKTMYDRYKSGDSGLPPLGNDVAGDARSSKMLEDFAGFSALRPEVLLRIAENCIHGLREDGMELHAAVVDRHSLTLEIRSVGVSNRGDLSGVAHGRVLVLTGEADTDANGRYPISAGMVEETLTTSKATLSFIPSGPRKVVGVRVYRKFLRNFAAAVEAADPLSEIEFGNVLVQEGAAGVVGQKATAPLYEGSEHIESDLAESLAQGVSVTELRETWADWHESGHVTDGQRLVALRILDDAEEW